MTQLRAIVADDSVVIRQGVARILAGGGFRVIAEARDATELLEAVAAERPHLAVVDIRMPPGGNAGLAAAITIRERHSTVGVLVLSQFLEPEYALRLLGAGVDRVGYLLKDRLGESHELLDAARRVAAGGSAVDPAVIAELVRARRRDDRLTRLTDREREALGLIAQGHSNRGIAERLGITSKTLEGMSGTIFSKLGLEDDPDVNRRVLAVLLYLDGAGGQDGPPIATA
jgi:DNA-binding NarL/FixJ family response regulator